MAFTEPCPRGLIDEGQPHQIEAVVYGRDSDRVALACSRCGRTRSLFDALSDSFSSPDVLGPDDLDAPARLDPDDIPF